MAIYGTPGPDDIPGTAEAEEIFGLAGNDTLRGFAGDDWLYGDEGNDSLLGGLGDDHLTGSLGNDTLRGGEGADILSTGLGTDLLDGGAGSDTVSFLEGSLGEFPFGAVIDLALGTFSYQGNTAQLVSIEGAIGSWLADTIRGGDGANALFGDAGNDSIFGGQGSDTLRGETGNDTLEGGGGTDLIDGGQGFDTALYTANTTSVFADLGLGQASFPGQSWPSESLISIEGVVTGSGADTLYGSTANNLLSAGLGNDRIGAGGGNDTLIGGDGQDSLFGGDGNDSLDGGFGVDNLSGLAGNDTLAGGGGRDYIDGGTGSDTVVYGPYRAPDGEYGPEFDPWHVTVNLIQGRASFTEPGFAPETLVSIENATTANGDDTLIGSEAANRLDAGGGANTVQGNGGGDTLIGGNSSTETGPDWLDSLPPSGGRPGYGDFIDGGTGNDLISGGGSYYSLDYSVPDIVLGYEVLRGGAGNDTITAGLGDIELTGGTGGDRFVFTDEVSLLGANYEWAWTEQGTITDFNKAQGDKIVVDLNVPSDEFDSDAPYVFRGGAADEAREWGWTRDGDDVVVTFNVVEGEEILEYQHDLLSVTIRLANFSGTLAASDFELV